MATGSRNMVDPFYRSGDQVRDQAEYFDDDFPFIIPSRNEEIEDAYDSEELYIQVCTNCGAYHTETTERCGRCHHMD